MKPWQRVVFSADCDEDGNCPHCGTDYSECSCPGPTMDGYEYREIKGQLWAWAIEDPEWIYEGQAEPLGEPAHASTKRSA